MEAPRHRLSPLAARSRSAGGVTILEIMIAVAILGILADAAAP